MKVQIVNQFTTPTACVLELKLEGMEGYQRIPLPTHKTLTYETLKAAIRTGIEQMALMKERMALIETLMFKEIELD